MHRLTILLGMVVLVPTTAGAQATVTDPKASTWINQRVITHFGTVLKVGGAVVDDEKRETTSRGSERNAFRVYRVKAVNGPWLWLVQEKGSASGWVKTDRVVPFDQAIDYYTGQIRANPGSSSLHISRGNIWSDKGEFDIAIGDYNEAIRLDPNSETAYNNRGNAWRAKAEYDKAIADYNEAI